MEEKDSGFVAESPEQAKDASIQDVVSLLSEFLGADAFQVVDRWGADFFSIGIARKGDPETLVYISTWQKPEGRYSATLHSAKEPWRDVSCCQDVDLDNLTSIELLGLVRLHLGLGLPVGEMLNKAPYRRKGKTRVAGIDSYRVAFRLRSPQKLVGRKIRT